MPNNVTAGSVSTIIISMLLAGCNPFESKFVAACETALKSRLRSPSGYKRVEVTEYNNPISIDEYVAIRRAEKSELLKFEIDYMKNSNKQPTRHIAFISYDAPNAYGTLVRGTSQCEYVTSDGDASRASEILVKIDGKTNTDRLIDAVKSMTQ